MAHERVTQRLGAALSHACALAINEFVGLGGLRSDARDDGRPGDGAVRYLGSRVTAVAVGASPAASVERLVPRLSSVKTARPGTATA